MVTIARQYATSVGTSATALDGTQYPSWILINNGGTTVFVGDSAVLTTTGFPIPANTTFSPSDLAHQSLVGVIGDRLYGIVVSGTEDVRVLLQGRMNV